MERHETYPGPGHNIAGSDFTVPDAAVLSARWARDHAALLARCTQLFDAFDRFEAAHGSGIKSEEIAARATDFARLLAREAESAERLRKQLKVPLLAATRALDQLFKTDLSARLSAAAAKVEALIGAWQRAKVSAELKLREEAARAAREAADRIATEARRTDDAALIQRAREADDAAQRVETALDAEFLTVGRTTGGSGAVASLKPNWVYEVVDFALVPREWLMIDDRKVRAAIRGKDGLRDIPGLHIKDEPLTVVR